MQFYYSCFVVLLIMILETIIGFIWYNICLIKDYKNNKEKYKQYKENEKFYKQLNKERRKLNKERRKYKWTYGNR